jgi:hypothetical protein
MAAKKTAKRGMKTKARKSTAPKVARATKKRGPGRPRKADTTNGAE